MSIIIRQALRPLSLDQRLLCYTPFRLPNEGASDEILLDQIQRDIQSDPYYRQNFPNDGQRFVAWYLRRVLLRDSIATRDDITDGANDKQIDALIVDDEERRVLIIQGKFIGARQVDAEPLRKVLGAWIRLQDLSSLQQDCNEKLKQKLEAVRRAIEDEYSIDFELLTTGTLTEAAQADLKAFSERLEESEDFTPAVHLVDTEVLQTRLSEAEAQELPLLEYTISLDSSKTLITTLGGAQTVLTVRGFETAFSTITGSPLSATR